MTELIDDRYELLEVIASGGMASVWRARDTRLGRLVALKRPHPAPSADDATRRMAREARAAAALNHPNVITVYDYGEDASGPFMVMELAEGPTLEEVMPDLEPASASVLGSQLADALAAIHAAGIVHRDVKPANVIMSERGPLLTDFGIARSPGDDATITGPGHVVATPSYAAPEVLAGDRPNTAADVYSLALVVAEISSGAPLFAGVERTEAIPPLNDPDLEAALRPALSTDPGLRPPAAALAASLKGAKPTTSGAWAPVVSTSNPTLVMDRPVVADVPPPPPVSSPATSRGAGMRWFAAALLLAALIFLLITRDPAGDDGTDDAVAAVDTTTTTLAVTTTVAPTTTLPPTTTTTTPPTTTTTTTTATDEVTEARDRLEEILLQPPREDLNENEVDEIMRRVDEAIASADAGEEDEASDLLGEVAATIDEKMRGRERQQAEDALADLADALGIRLRDGGQDDDDG